MSAGIQTLVSFALELEAGALRQRALPSATGILVTGMGRRKAEAAVADFLQRQSPGVVFTCGFAGGLNPELKPGDVLFETTDGGLRERLMAAGANLASFHCADRIATTIAEKSALRQQTGADAVEMESGAIHALCRERDIRCATVRAISDTANEDLPLDFNRISNPDQSLNYGKLAWAIARSPGAIPGLLRLQKNSRIAAERLAEVLLRVISPA